MTDSEHNHDYAQLAWCGWSLPIPGDFQPLKIEGGWMRGSLMLGVDDQPILLIKWWRPEEKRFNALKWLAKRFKALHAWPDDDPAAPLGFDPVGWVENLQQKEGVGKTVWYGYAPEAGLVVEWISTSTVPGEHRDLLFKDLLPKLEAAAPEDPVTWSLFSTTFQSPPGYTLVQHRLMLGDIALELHDEQGQRLILRQVYPASLATQRRSPERWLDQIPFMERRQLRASETETDDEQALVAQSGWKRLPFPMGWLKPRYCTRIARTVNDRLLMAESQTRRAADTEAVEHAVSAMVTDGRRET